MSLVSLSFSVQSPKVKRLSATCVMAEGKAPKTKRLTVEALEDSFGSEDDSGDSNSSDSSSTDSQLDQEVQVDFEARQVEEGDYHGIRRLLQQVFLKASVDTSGLASLIVAQGNIGSTIKVCDDGMDSGQEEGSSGADEDNVYGITTALNLNQHRSQDCVIQLQEMLLQQCSSHAASKLPRLSSLLGDASKPVGLLVNERVLNIPAEIAPPLLRGLVLEVREAKRKGLPFDLHYYLLIARSHVVSVARPLAGKKRRRKGGTPAAAASQGTDQRLETNEDPPVFDCFENEILQKESVLSFSYPVVEESDSVLGGRWSFDDEAMKPCRTVMVLPAGRLEHAIAEVEAALRH